jgi:hypothetical protein
MELGVILRTASHGGLWRVLGRFLFAVPIGPPVAEETPLGVEELLLAGAELVVSVDLMQVGAVTLEDHEFLVKEDKVRAFVEG